MWWMWDCVRVWVFKLKWKKNRCAFDCNMRINVFHIKQIYQVKWWMNINKLNTDEDDVGGVCVWCAMSVG